MENKEEILYWKKYRPKTLEELILLPRIYNSIKDGLNNNYIFYGTCGLGKTALVEVLTNKYSTMKINASLYTSIDILRDKVYNFINKFSLSDADKEMSMKIVFFDEFEKMSNAALDALKAYIEDYADDVRFVATTNYIHKIDKNVLSRFTAIQFNPINKEEELILKNGTLTYLKNIVKCENINLSDDDLKRVIKTNFPDIRSMCNVIQDFNISGVFNIYSTGLNQELKQLVFDNIMGNLSTEETYVLSLEFENDIYQLFTILGRPFVEFLLKSDVVKYKTIVEDIVILVTRYNYMFSEKLDPVIHAYALLADVKKIIYTK